MKNIKKIVDPKLIELNKTIIDFKIKTFGGLSKQNQFILLTNGIIFDLCGLISQCALNNLNINDILETMINQAFEDTNSCLKKMEKENPQLEVGQGIH